MKNFEDAVFIPVDYEDTNPVAGSPVAAPDYDALSFEPTVNSTQHQAECDIRQAAATRQERQFVAAERMLQRSADRQEVRRKNVERQALRYAVFSYAYSMINSTTSISGLLKSMYLYYIAILNAEDTGSNTLCKAILQEEG